MPTLIDKPQLQATAQVAKSFILDQAISTADSLISAMSLSGGSSTPAPAGKTKGVITVSGDNLTVDYNGDGDLYFVAGYEENEAKWSTIQSGENISDYINDNSWNYPNGLFVFAPETDNYTAAVYSLY